MRSLMAIAMLAGCATAAPPEADVPAAGEGACNAARVQNLVGRPRSEALGAEALRRSGAATLRWIGPGDMVTQDYRTDRLNLDLDANGRVTGLRCG